MKNLAREQREDIMVHKHDCKKLPMYVVRLSFIKLTAKEIEQMADRFERTFFSEIEK